MKNEKKSKVAICEKCQSYVMACHTDHSTTETEKTFSELKLEGFTVITEWMSETKNRNFSWWKDCKKGLCVRPLNLDYE